MSFLQEMLDRLSGVSTLRDRVNDLKQNLQEHREFLIDHERRLARLEASQPSPAPKKGLSK